MADGASPDEPEPARSRYSRHRPAGSAVITPPPDLVEFDARLQAARKAAGLIPPEPVPEVIAIGRDNRDMGLGARIAAELVGGVLFGLLIGLGLDRWLEIKPWGLIAGVLIGTVAGFMNVYRAASGQGYAAGFKGSDPRSDDDR
jgi:ATP synthase protein I